MIISIIDQEQIVNSELRRDGGDAAMKIVRLPAGEAAPVDSDCISIDTVSGSFRLTGSLLTGVESRAIVDGTLYGSRDGAEAAGIAWAAESGVTTLYIALDSPGPA